MMPITPNVLHSSLPLIIWHAIFLCLPLLRIAEESSCSGSDSEHVCSAVVSSGCGAAKLCSELASGDWLAAGEWLTSPSGKFVAILEGEQLRIHSAGSSEARWVAPDDSSRDGHLAAAKLIFGKLMLENTAGKEVWSSPTHTLSIRFSVEATRSGNSGTQISELSLWEKGKRISWEGARASSDRDSPSNQSPQEAIDDKTDTKWYTSSSQGASLLVKLPLSQSIAPDQFSFTTADDMDERDPVNWKMEGSFDGTNWIIMHHQRAAYPTPQQRKTSTERFNLMDVWVSFATQHFQQNSNASLISLSDDGTLAVTTLEGSVLWVATLNELSAAHNDPEVEHMRSMANCVGKLSCRPCIESGCAWCLAGRRCVTDKAWICQGDEDHVSPPGHRTIGKASCPDLADIEEGHRKRRERVAAAQIAAPHAPSETNPSAKMNNRSSHTTDGGSDDRDDADGPEIDPALLAELRRRLRLADEAKGGKPYDVLNVPRDASASTIRKAYRQLSKKFHPDKWVKAKKEFRLNAETVFADITRAYETVGTPDKRAAFDDGVNFDESRGQGDENFYFGDPLITTLTEELWERRLAGTSIWLIEFYAAWCPACRSSRQQWKEIARRVEHLPIEVGAVNCVRQRRICSEYMGISSYPSVRLVNREFGTVQEYKKGLNVDDMPGWAEKIAREWTWLFHNARVHRDLGPSSFVGDGLVAHSDAMWIVSFVDGLECRTCKAAATNLMRLSASLNGLPVEVGVVDCSLPEMREFCYVEHQVPAPPHRPLTKAWRAGPKNATGKPEPGEVLYGAAELEPHVAFMLIEKVARLALADRLAPDALVSGNASGFDADDEPELPPQPSQPNGHSNSNWGDMPELNWDESGISDRRALPRPWQTWTGAHTAQLTR